MPNPTPEERGNKVAFTWQKDEGKSTLAVLIAAAIREAVELAKKEWMRNLAFVDGNINSHIRAATIEECAKVAEEHVHIDRIVAAQVAKAIRAIKETK